MTEPAKHSVSVAGVIVNDEGQVLLIRRRDNGHWEPPGGVLELGETLEDGLRREVREETGLIVQPLRLTGVYKNMRLGVIAMVLRCELIDGELLVNDEVSDFYWASSFEVDRLLAEVYRVRVTDALVHDGSPALRSHDGESLL